MVLIMVSSWAFCGGRFQPVAHCDGSFSPENRCPQGPLRGQKRKSSERANVFRFTPESGQTADASGCHDRTHALQQQNSVVGSSRPRRQASHSRNGCYEISTADRPHSALMLASRITLAHFSVSSAMSLPKSPGEPPSVVPPRSASCALILGSASAALISLLSLLMISDAVFLGAPIPHQALAW